LTEQLFIYNLMYNFKNVAQHTVDKVYNTKTRSVSESTKTSGSMKSNAISFQCLHPAAITTSALYVAEEQSFT
jgi:hypothetical protein